MKKQDHNVDDALRKEHEASRKVAEQVQAGLDPLTASMQVAEQGEEIEIDMSVVSDPSQAMAVIIAQAEHTANLTACMDELLKLCRYKAKHLVQRATMGAEIEHLLEPMQELATVLTEAGTSLPPVPRLKFPDEPTKGEAHE